MNYRAKINITLFKAVSKRTLLVLAAFSILTPLVTPFQLEMALAEDRSNFTLFFNNDDKTINDLKAAASDGGLGDNDVRILRNTKVFTKGGRLGTTALQFDAEKSNKQDMPIYKLDYYCYPTEDYKLTTSPDKSKPYVRYSLGVALMESNNWKGIVSDKNYKTRVGLSGNTGVGDFHIPSKQDSNASSADYTGAPEYNEELKGKGGENDIRDDIERVFQYRLLDPNRQIFKEYDRSIRDNDEQVFQKCMPNPKGNIGNGTSNYSKLSSADKKDWDDKIKDAGLGESAAKAATASGAGGQGGNQADCDAKGSSPLSWIICPIIDLGAGLTDFVFQQIVSPLLRNVPVSTDRNDPSYITWQQFRVIGNLLLVGSLLAVVYSQAKGGK